MFCTKCGKELADDAKFCNSCGTPVQDVGDSGSSTIGKDIYHETTKKESSIDTKRPNKRIIGIVCVAVVACVAIVLIVIGVTSSHNFKMKQQYKKYASKDIDGEMSLNVARYIGMDEDELCSLIGYKKNEDELYPPTESIVNGGDPLFFVTDGKVDTVFINKDIVARESVPLSVNGIKVGDLKKDINETLEADGLLTITEEMRELFGITNETLQDTKETLGAVDLIMYATLDGNTSYSVYYDENRTCVAIMYSKIDEEIETYAEDDINDVIAQIEEDKTDVKQIEEPEQNTAEVQVDNNAPETADVSTYDSIEGIASGLYETDDGGIQVSVSMYTSDIEGSEIGCCTLSGAGTMYCTMNYIDPQTAEIVSDYGDVYYLKYLDGNLYFMTSYDGGKQLLICKEIYEGD